MFFDVLYLRLTLTIGRWHSQFSVANLKPGPVFVRSYGVRDWGLTGFSRGLN